jgi:hypothetical protein
MPVLGLVGLLVAAMIETARAAAPFDGTWVGGGVVTSVCPYPMNVEMTVRDSRKKPDGSLSTGVITSSKITPDGTANVIVGERLPASLQFTNDHFEGTFSGFCGTRPISGSRSK